MKVKFLWFVKLNLIRIKCSSRIICIVYRSKIYVLLLYLGGDDCYEEYIF